MRWMMHWMPSNEAVGLAGMGAIAAVQIDRQAPQGQQWQKALRKIK